MIGGTGAFTTSGGNAAWFSYTSTTDMGYLDLSKGQTKADGTSYETQTNSVYKNGGEVRTANYTVKIWLRVA